MPTLELEQEELDLLVEAVAAHLDIINVATEKAMAEGDSEQAGGTTRFTPV